MLIVQIAALRLEIECLRAFLWLRNYNLINNVQPFPTMLILHLFNWCVRNNKESLITP